MIKNRYGRIINISSVVGSTGNLGQQIIQRPKAGMEGMSKSMALGSKKKYYYKLCSPGFIETDMTKDLLIKNGENLKIISLWAEWVFLMK